MARKTQVTHPDGTTSVRQSANAIYTHAAEVTEDMRAKAEGKRQSAAQNLAFAADCRAAAIEGEVVEETRSWSRGDTYVNVYFARPGHKKVYATGYVFHADGEVKESNQVDLGAKIEEQAVNAERSAANLLAQAEALDAGPAVTYGVYRWSRSAALAAKGAEEARQYYKSVRVVEATEVPTKTKAVTLKDLAKEVRS